MQSRTKIIVLHLKEVLYTGIFIILGILFLLLLFIVFLPKKAAPPETAALETGIYIPGNYTTSLILGSSSVDIEVIVDENTIASIRLVDPDEAVTTMYPLMQPALDDIASQICLNQSLEQVNYSNDNKYTVQVLMEAISSALSQARIPSENIAAADSGSP